MDCPKCKVKMLVTHTYKVCGEAATSRHTCPKCNSVCTAVTVALFRDPVAGQGAYSIEKVMKKDKSLQNRVKAVFRS